MRQIVGIQRDLAKDCESKQFRHYFDVHTDPQTKYKIHRIAYCAAVALNSTTLLLTMDSFVTPPPPAYEDENASSNYLWRIRNAKLCSQFSTTTPTHIPAYREHLERMKNIVVQQCSVCMSSHSVSSSYNLQIKDSASKTHKSSVVNIQYREAFADIGQLICEYRDILNRIKPLQEEEVLFLLLSRYAQASGTDVYLEMRRPENVQIYDSSISEPLVRENILMPFRITDSCQSKRQQWKACRFKRPV
jgi:hypothetical protein